MNVFLMAAGTKDGWAVFRRRAILDDFPENSGDMPSYAVTTSNQRFENLK